MAIYTNGFYQDVGQHAPDPYLQTWTRENLPEPENYYITDADMIIRNRNGNLMLIEVKRRNAEMRSAQRATYQILDALIRSGADVNKAGLKIDCMRFPVKIKYKGFHLLQFENTTFKDGRVFWDHCEVSEQQLTEILSFKADPFYYTNIAQPQPQAYARTD